MKEVTRIHIAKIPYSIEIDAKKGLEAYLKTLEAYSEDAEIINDIEIRITEILADRRVLADGIISGDDVKALRQQLGEPQEFMDGDRGVEAGDKRMNGDVTRKLYRNLDNAVLGGVLSGIAAFFGVNPLWIRLAFIIMAVGSFGTVLLVYIVLWIVVPPAKTAADKLQMVGRPVTITSIRELNENELGSKGVNNVSKARSVVFIMLGILSVIAAVGGAAMTAIGIVAVTRDNGYLLEGGDGAGFFLAAFILAIISGVALIIFFILMAYAFFAQKMKRRVWISMIIVVATGLATFGTALGLAQYGNLRTDTMIRANTHEANLEMPTGSENITAFSTTVPGIEVRYIVSNEKPRAVVRTTSKEKNSMNDLMLAVEGNVLSVKGMSDFKISPLCNVVWCDGPYVIVYGPALKQITTANKSNIEYSATNQQELAVNVTQGADVNISSGVVDQLSLSVTGGGEINTANATIKSVNATVKDSSRLELATIESLILTTQESCANKGKSDIELWMVSSGMITVNNEQKAAKSMNLACTNVSVEGSED